MFSFRHEGIDRIRTTGFKPRGARSSLERDAEQVIQFHHGIAVCQKTLPPSSRPQLPLRAGPGTSPSTRGSALRRHLAAAPCPWHIRRATRQPPNPAPAIESQGPTPPITRSSANAPPALSGSARPPGPPSGLSPTDPSLVAIPSTRPGTRRKRSSSFCRKTGGGLSAKGFLLPYQIHSALSCRGGSSRGGLARFRAARFYGGPAFDIRQRIDYTGRRRRAPRAPALLPSCRETGAG